MHADGQDGPDGPDDPAASSDPGLGRGRAAPRHRAVRRRPLWQELSIVLVVALLAAFLIKSFVVGVYFIPSGSMENTLRVGDRVAVDKVGYRLHDIRRGDVVVFNGVDSFTPEGTVAAAPHGLLARAARGAAGLVGLAPPDERDFVKRVIGIPGDRVMCCDAQGRVTVNGVPLEESSYLYPGDVPSSTTFDVIVPEGKLWVMGDHRSNSADSRSHIGDPGGGMVPEDKVIGRVRAILWPFSHWSGIGSPPAPAPLAAGAGERP